MSSSSSRFSLLTRCLILFLGLLHLGIAVWNSVILSTAEPPTELLLAYVGCECAFRYLGFLIYLMQVILNSPNCCKGVMESFGTGMFIWNTVMLFGVLDGIPQSPTSPFAYFVFVNFFINIAVIALSIVACVGVCCCLTAFLVAEEAASGPSDAEVQASIAATKIALEKAKTMLDTMREPRTVELTSVTVQTA